MVVLGKEVREALRDRRAAGASLAYALIGPMVLLVVLVVLNRTNATATDVGVHFIGAAAAPGLEAALAERGFVEQDSADIVIDVSEDFAGALAKGEPARIAIRVDLARRSAALARLRGAISAWGDGVAGQRLVARGVPPEQAHPLRVDVFDQGTIDPSAQFVVDAIIFIILSAPFFGGISLASDSTAGERERHSLAPLLQQPVAAGDVILGKWMVIAGASLAGSCATVLGVGIVMRSPLAATLGAQIRFGGLETLQLIAALLPLTAAASAVQLVVALGTRTYKAGQTYLTLLTFAPFLALMLARSPRGEALVGYPVAMLWDVGTISRLLTGEVVHASSLAGAVLMYALLILVVLRVGTRQLRRLVQLDA